MAGRMSRLEDEAALRRTAEVYAAGADRRDKVLWTEVMTEDCVIEGPGFRIAGRDAVLGSIDLLTRNGDRAEGETYSTADHLVAADGGKSLLCWSIRYQDQWRREGGAWRFSHRTLIVDWEETRTLGQ